MNEKKLKVVSLIFSLMVALAMVGGNWDISLAQGTIPRTPPPSPPAAPAPLIGSIITAGIGHTCAITPADGIRCWGLNEAGQLGDRTWVDSTVPVHVVDVLASGVTDLDAGHHHTCALTSGGRVMCWGKNDKGQLGNGTFEDSNVPVFVQGLAGITTSIHTGADFTCAVSNAGRVSCWGNNSTGQLNDGTTENRNVAVLTDPEISGIKMISGG